jgi:hypothetical protein
MAGIVGIADFVNVGGISQLLIVNGINGVLIIATAAGTSLVVDQHNRISLLRWTSVVFAASFVVVWALQLVGAPAKLISALLFLLSQQQWLVFPMFFWVLVNDMFEVSQTKRLIPIIGSWSFIGKVIGIGAAIVPGLLSQLGVLPNSELTINGVLGTNVVIYVAIIALMSFGFRNLTLTRPIPQKQHVREVLTEGWTFVKDVPSFRYLQIAVLLICMCDVITDFRVLVVAKAAIPDPIDYKQFYSYYLLSAAIISFVIQGFFTGKIIQKLGLKNTFLVQPGMAFGVSAFMLALPGWFMGNVVSSNLLKISRNTIDESNGKAFQGLIPEERRGRVALLMNNYTPAAGYILGSVLASAVLYVGLAQGFTIEMPGYLAVSVLAGLSAIAAIWTMRKHYDQSLFNWRLKRRTRASSVLSKLEF